MFECFCRGVCVVVYLVVVVEDELVLVRVVGERVGEGLCVFVGVVGYGLCGVCFWCWGEVVGSSGRGGCGV